MKLFCILLQFRIVYVPVFIPLCLFVKIFSDRFCQINPGLVCNADKDKQHIREFVCQVVLRLGFFEALIAVNSGHDSGDFSDFFHQLRQIGQFGKISHADTPDPFVNAFLVFAEA